MARIELYKALLAIKEADWQVGDARINLSHVTNSDLEKGNITSIYILHAVDEIDAAIAELQKAKQILTKED